MAPSAADKLLFRASSVGVICLRPKDHLALSLVHISTMVTNLIATYLLRFQSRSIYGPFASYVKAAFWFFSHFVAYMSQQERSARKKEEKNDKITSH